MRKVTADCSRILLVASLLLLAWALSAHAQNSLGVGVSEQGIKPEGVFGPLLFWIQQQQKEFYRGLTDALKLIRSGDGGSWVLIVLSFTYGVLHAAGPGHGKAVISSYMLANEVQLRRGIILSFASAFLQGLVAVIGIGSLIFFLREMGLKQAVFTHWMEVASYAGITLLGLWLLYRKLFGDAKKATRHHHSHHDHHHGHKHDEGGVCSECGHSHAPDPKNLSGDFGLKEAWSAVFAVGLRPCTGAIVVLTFAFLNGLYLAGIAAVFAMALGTGITVAVIASLAVGAKTFALRYSRAGVMSQSVSRFIEIAGAGFVFVIGVTLLAASLQ